MGERQIISDEESDVLADVVFNSAAKLVGAIVERSKLLFDRHAGDERVERYVRATIGLGFLTIAASQLRGSGLTLDDAKQKVAEVWDDWSEDTADTSSEVKGNE